MAVYIINNMTLHDPAEYARYLRLFMPVFRKFGGQVVAAVDQPQPLEGEWPYDRTIVLSFPSRAEARRWIESPDYQEIVGHRHRGAQSNVVMLDGLGHVEPAGGDSGAT